jgi:AraC-like DNA-binding protein/mannose-6-phosphate isomerase-like protein (cupin superfamily)
MEDSLPDIKPAKNIKNNIIALATESQAETGQAAIDESVVETYDNLYAKRTFGTLDYPVSIHYLDLRVSYMNRITWHWHEEMEIIIINDGIAEIATDDATYTIEPGQSIIINQNVMHSIYSVDEHNCTFYSVVFNPAFLFGYNSGELQQKFLLPVQNLHLFKIMVLDEKNPWHERMMDALNDAVAANMTKPFGYEIATKGHLCRFWAELVSKMPQMQNVQQTSPHTSLDEQRVKQAMLYIRTHYAESISLEDIADSIHISKSECCRCFSRTLQMTPFEYLMKYRIFEATKKMTDNAQEPMSISDLALSVGFNNTSYFNKLFKKYLGCTPTYYRKHKVLANDGRFNSPFSVPMV